MATITQSHDDAWNGSLNHVMDGVITLHSAAPFSFNQSRKSYGQGSGFIVDERGIILTSRHVLSEGPMYAEAVFQSGARQCAIVPIYHDPIHDFAFAKYNVPDLHGLPFKAIKLAPELAKAGQKIRVLGNDTAQTMSILPGVISRTDCDPPQWDSLISYIQGSSDTAGGSSGSPVIIPDGSAVGMVAGGFMSSIDVYMPLDLPVHVLEALRSGTGIPRGTIQSSWTLQKPADCYRRGLSYEEIQKYSPDGSGLLVAKEILLNGPSDSLVEESDILLTVNDQNIKSPSHFEQLMDGAVGKTLHVKAWRHGNTLEYELHVEDLWTIRPCRLLQFAGASFQDLCYQEALKYHVPAGGVTVADAEGSFEGLRNTIIRSLNNQNTSNLDAFISVARNIPDQARVAVEYQILNGDLKSRFQTITIDRRWLREDMTLRSRKRDDTASWHVQDLGPPPAAVSQPPQVLPEGQKTEFPIVQKITPNVVYVHARTPYQTDGTRSQDVKYMGLVINASKGLVITARSFIPSTLCILRVCFADSIEVPAKRVYDHALGFTVIQYDTSLIKGSIGSVSLSQKVPKVQDKITIYGPEIDGSGPFPTKVTVKCIGPMTGDYECERYYHPINVDVLHLAEQTFGGTGVLLDENGDLQGLWLPFHVDGDKWAGVPLSLLLPVFHKLQQGIVPSECRMLDVELEAVHKDDVKAFGVPEETVKAFPERNFIQVKKISCSHQNGLEAGDVILSQGKKPVTHMSDLYDMFTEKSLWMSVIRCQVKVDVDVPTIPVSSRQSDRVVWFAGAQFEQPYSPVPLCARGLYSQVLVTHIQKGSPADMYNLPSYHFVTQVQGVATVDFDSFTKGIKEVPDGQFCHLTLLDLLGCARTVSLKNVQRDFKTSVASQKKGNRSDWHCETL